MKYLSLPIYFSDESEAKLPSYAYGDDAGCDLYSSETTTILPHSCESVDLGFSTAIPRGYYGKIESRSGLARDHMIIAVGGVIDSNFRGNWCVLLANLSKTPYTVKTGDKIAQVIFHKKEHVAFLRVEKHCDLGKTKRGKKGFGSSNAKKLKIESDEENYSCDPNHPSYSCPTQPLPTDFNGGVNEDATDSDSDCEIVESSGKMKTESGEIIKEF